jgi:hypothetical protein
LPFFEYEDQRTEPRWVQVDTTGVRVENCRQFGGPWLALQLIEQLRLDEFLTKQLPQGRERVPWSLTAMILVIARLLDPSSELHIAEQWYHKTSLPELLRVSADCVDDNRLYRGLDALLPHKNALEAHLKNRLGELFRLEYDLLLYDVTSTYFEGQAKSNPTLHRGPTQVDAQEVRTGDSPSGVASDSGWAGSQTLSSTSRRGFGGSGP